MTAAATTVAYMKAHNLHSLGDVRGLRRRPDAVLANNRAKGWLDQKAIPGAKFVTTEKNMLNDYDRQDLARSRHSSGRRQERDVIENVDIGAGYAARAIKDAGRAGRRSAQGWNVTPSRSRPQGGTQIAMFDQNGSGGLARRLRQVQRRPAVREHAAADRDHEANWRARRPSADIKTYALNGLPTA
jgi:hypothetical protein